MAPQALSGGPKTEELMAMLRPGQPSIQKANNVLAGQLRCANTLNLVLNMSSLC
jgi:hypothetical protein